MPARNTLNSGTPCHRPPPTVDFSLHFTPYDERSNFFQGLPLLVFNLIKI